MCRSNQPMSKPKTPSIAPRFVRELRLRRASAAGRRKHLSAASGLVFIATNMYVIADDEHHLAIFPREGDTPGRLYRLVEGHLPHTKKARKKQKPDFEVLVRLPPFGDDLHGALLAAGSGSRPNRQRAALVKLGPRGGAKGAPRTIDLSFIFGPLKKRLPEINIEGAVVTGDNLLLFQRGNKGAGTNAVIRYALAPFLKALQSRKPRALKPLSVRSLDLGRIKGVPLTFTDAVAVSGGYIVFSAVAEDTDDAYADGGCLGSGLGLLAPDGTLQWLRRLTGKHKIEGIEADATPGALNVFMVTDADDAKIAGKLLACRIVPGTRARS